MQILCGQIPMITQGDFPYSSEIFLSLSFPLGRTIEKDSFTLTLSNPLSLMNNIFSPTILCPLEAPGRLLTI